jgi:hypothetical protein
MRSDVPQPTQPIEEKDTLGVIVFLRLKTGHLRPKDGVLNGNYYELLGEQIYLFSATRTHT